MENSRERELAPWLESFRRELANFLDPENLNAFGAREYPLPCDPESLGILGKMSLFQHSLAILAIYECLGINFTEDIVVHRYTSWDYLNNKINVNVLKTNIEDVFLHRLQFPDGDVRLAVGLGREAFLSNSQPNLQP